MIRDIAWKAQLRLTQLYRHLRMGRKLHQNKVCIAIARELAGLSGILAATLILRSGEAMRSLNPLEGCRHGLNNPSR